MKKPISLFLFMLSTLFFVHSQNLDSMLLLYYPFNGNANDASGNGYHGTVFNASLADDRFGNPNSAYYFNGTSSYITLPNVSALKPALPITISFWIKLDNLTQENTQIASTDYTENTYHGVFINMMPGSWNIAVNYGDGTPNITNSTTRRTKIGTTTLNNTQWYHVTCIVRGPTDMSIYINCVDDGGSYNGSGGPIAYGSNSGNIGIYDIAGSSPWYFKGYLDEFRYWDRALTHEEITGLCELTGIQDNGDNLESIISIYPNPASDVLFVKHNENNENASYNIISVLGETVISGLLHSKEMNEINIEQIPSGIYFIIVNDKEKQHSKKFIKL